MVYTLNDDKWYADIYTTEHPFRIFGLKQTQPQCSITPDSSDMYTWYSTINQNVNAFAIAIIYVSPSKIFVSE
jgi:chloramphenicol O-acetyltransferase